MKQSLNVFLLVRAGVKKTALIAVILIAVFMAVSCRTHKDIKTEIKTEYIVETDTIVHEVHDTTKITQIKIDSVDRYVEKKIYVDSNGVIHEKEIERLCKYIFLQDDEMRVKEEYYKQKIEELTEKVKESSETHTEYIEKELKWWQKTLMWMGVLSVFVYWFLLYNKLRKNKNG